MRYLAYLTLILAALIAVSHPARAEEEVAVIPAATPPPVDWFIRNDAGEVVGVNWEAEKQQHQIPTDTLVFFHTGGTPMTPETAPEILSAMGLVNVYAGRFDPNGTNLDPDVRDWEPTSGHYRDGVEVFYQYQWAVFADGTTVRLLEDHEVAWACGNWRDGNCRGIMIAFVGDFSAEGSSPTPEAIRAAAGLTRYYVEKFFVHDGIDPRAIRILGHRDLSARRPVSPGEWFYQGGLDQILEKADVVRGVTSGFVPIF